MEGGNGAPESTRKETRIDIDDETQEDEDERGTTPSALPPLREERRRRRRGSLRESGGMLSAPSHVHNNEWRDMLRFVGVGGGGGSSGGADAGGAPPPERPPRRNSAIDKRSRSNTTAQRSESSWITQNLNKRECISFVASHKYNNRCGCGASLEEHCETARRHVRSASKNFLSDHSRNPSEDFVAVDSTTEGVAQGGGNGSSRWTIRHHTLAAPTDAFGNIEFDGGGHQSTAKYARVAFDSSPDLLLTLLLNIWRVRPPKMIITIHGGIANFELNSKLARSLRRGLMKAAASTDTWIITSGLHQGVVRHVCAAIEDLRQSRRTHERVCSIGIAPWGLLKKRRRLIHLDGTVRYNMNTFASGGRFAELDESHSAFLLADNGTVGRYGAEIVLRRRFETLLATGTAPLVCLLIEGGVFTVKLAHDYLTVPPHLPVVVFDGSGRASDLIAYAHRSLKHRDYLSESAKAELLELIRTIFDLQEPAQCSRVLRQLTECAQTRKLLTIYRHGDDLAEEFDHAIFSTLLKGSAGSSLTPLEQLRLALAWDRADVAQKEIFGSNSAEWSSASLQSALLEALLHDRVSFVNLLLDYGVPMHNFLTFERLEHLYNSDFGPQNALLRTVLHTDRPLTLVLVGQAIDQLMGRGYQSLFTSPEFIAKYSLYRSRHGISQKNGSIGNSDGDNGGVRKKNRIASLFSPRATPLNGKVEEHEASNDDDDAETPQATTEEPFVFERPFHEILLWAVLTRRHELARCMWRHGEEPLAKALVACRLNLALAQAAEADFLELQLLEELNRNAEEFRSLSTELLKTCHAADDDLAATLLTYELANWGRQTCLSLADNVENLEFIGHPCSQVILSEMWHGGLQARSNSNWTVLAGIFFPPLIALLEFKSKEELRRQPHTAAEHAAELSDYESTDSELSDSDTDSETESRLSSDDEEIRKHTAGRSRSSTVHSLSVANLIRASFRRKEKEPPSPVLRSMVAQLQPSFFTPGISPPLSPVRDALSPAYPSALLAKEPSSLVPRASTATRAPTRRIHNRRRASTVASAASSVPERVSMPQKTEAIESDGVWTTRNGPEEKERRRPSRHAFPSPPPAASHDVARRKGTPLSWRRRIIEFYTAPVTTFWLWSISFAVFHVALIFSLVLKTLPELRPAECFLISYIVAYACDMIRKFVFFDMQPLRLKLRHFFLNLRDGSLILAIFFSLAGFSLRVVPETLMIGRVLLIMTSVLWSFKLIDYVSVHRWLGPYITIAGEMIPKTVAILTMLFISVLSFGLVRQAATYPNEEWHWLLVRNLFLKPYYMLYGEVYADEIDKCGESRWDRHVTDGTPIDELEWTEEDARNCVEGYWVSPIYMTFYMLIATVLLMNTMVASCTYVYEKRVSITAEMWLFDRFRQVMEYDAMPFLPPPFTLFYHLFLLFRFWRVRNEQNTLQRLRDRSLKLFLSAERLAALHRFEGECLEDMMKARERKAALSTEESVQRTAVRSEEILSRLSGVHSVESLLRDSLREVDTRLSALENRKREDSDCLARLTNQMDLLVQRLLSGDDSSSLLGVSQLRPPPLPTLRMPPPNVFVVAPETEEDEESNERSTRVESSQFEADDECSPRSYR